MGQACDDPSVVLAYGRASGWTRDRLHRRHDLAGACGRGSAAREVHAAGLGSPNACVVWNLQPEQRLDPAVLRCRRDRRATVQMLVTEDPYCATTELFQPGDCWRVGGCRNSSPRRALVVPVGARLIFVASRRSLPAPPAIGVIESLIAGR